MAFRLGHQITCNINKNLFFRNSSASVRRYRSLSRGNESRVEREDAAAPEAIRPRSSRARSQPRSSRVSIGTRREYSTESSSNQQQQQQSQAKNVIATKNSFRKSNANYSLQPKNLPPMATTHIHINSNFSPMEELPDARPYENRLGEVQRQASVKYEQAVRTFNISSRGPGPSGSYRYELDAAKPKLDKGTNVYNVVAAIKSREQSIAAQAPQLQPKNIRPYGDIMTKPWCTPLMERIKHKPLSITRLEEAIHKSVMKKQSRTETPQERTLEPKQNQPPPPILTNAASESTTNQVEEPPRTGVTSTKPVDQVTRRGYSTINRRMMSTNNSSDSEQPTKGIKEYKSGAVDYSDEVEESSGNQEVKTKADKDKFAMESATSMKSENVNEHDSLKKPQEHAPIGLEQLTFPPTSGHSVGKVVLYYDKKGSRENILRAINNTGGRITINKNVAMANVSLSHPNLTPEPRTSEPPKVKVGPKLKLQSWNVEESGESLIPASGEKFTVPWLSWGDRVKLKQQKGEAEEKVDHVFKSPLVRTAEKKTSKFSEFQVRRYSSGRSIDEGEAVVESRLEIPSHRDFVAGVDWPVDDHFLKPNNKIQRMHIRSYSTGLKDECFCEDPLPKPKPEPKGHDPWCDPTHFEPTQTNPDCKKGCVLGPEYTVMVKLRRLPKIKIPDPVRYCPEPCDEAVRADDGIKVEQKTLPKLVAKPCPPVPTPCMTTVPLVRLKKRVDPPPIRICPPPPCTYPRADDGLKVLPKKLPRLEPKMCGRCEEVVMTSPPLYRLKAKPVPPPKPCIPPSCPEPPITRADAGMKVVRKNLPILKPPCCPRICEDHLVDGPPLPRLKCDCVREPERVCPCIPTVRDPCCPPRADEICNYTIVKKKLPAMVLSERYNKMSTSDFARAKKNKGKRSFSTYSKCDMCCYSDKKVQPDLEAIKKDIHSSEWEDFKGYLTPGKDGFIEAYDTFEVAGTSTGADLRIVKKPIGGMLIKREDEVQNRLLKGGYTAKFGDLTDRMYSSSSHVASQKRLDCDSPPAEHIPFKYPKLKRLKKRKDFDKDFQEIPWELKDKKCNVLTCDKKPIVDPPPRMDAVLNYQVKSKILPVIPRGNCRKIVKQPPKGMVALERPKKRFHYKDEPRNCVVPKCEDNPRADDSAPTVEKKLPPVPMSDCLPVKQMQYRECKKLVRLNLKGEDPPRNIEEECPPPVICSARADDGKNFAARKSLPFLEDNDCPPLKPPKYRDCKPLKRLPPHPFMEREPCPPPITPCTEVVRADWLLKEEEFKELPPLLKKDGKLLKMPTPMTCPESTTKRRFSTLSMNFSFNENFTQFEKSGRHLSRTSIFRTSKDCKIKKDDDKKLEKKIPKFTLPNCKPRTEPPLCDRPPIYPECTKQKSPYPSFSECKDDDPYIGLTECPQNNKYLQPKFPLIGEFIIMKPPPPAQKKIDPKLEEDCVIRKLNLKRETIGTKTCSDFHRPYIPLRAKDIMKAAMKQATVLHAEDECKKGKKRGKQSLGKDCPVADDSSCIPGDVECELIGKDMDTMLCADAKKKRVLDKTKKGEPGDLICKAVIKDCSPKAKAAAERPKMVPCEPYIPKPSPPKKSVCKKPMICDPPPNPQDKKKDGGKKAAITSKINRPMKGGNGNGGTNSSGGGQIRNVGGGGGGAGIAKESGGKQAKSDDQGNAKDKCAQLCIKKKEGEDGEEKKCEGKESKELVLAKEAAVTPAKCKKEKPCTKKSTKCDEKKKKEKAVCSADKDAKKPKQKKSRQELLKERCEKKKKVAKKTIAIRCQPPKDAAKDRKSIAIKCSPLKKAAVPMTSKCPVQPAPIVSAVCPKKSLWDRILEFFRARPNCPAPDQWKKDKLKREAERAAAAAGYDLCEKKKVFVCAVKGDKAKEKGKKPCPFPPPPPPPKAPGGKPKKDCKTKKRTKCGMKVKQCAKGPQKREGENPKFKCKPRNKGGKKPSKGSGKCTFSKGPSGNNQSLGTNTNSIPRKKVASSAQMNISSYQAHMMETSYTPRREFPYYPEYSEVFSKMPMCDKSIFAKSKSSLTPKQTRPFSTQVRYFSSPSDDECKSFQPPQSACRLPKPKNCGPNPRGFDCSIKAPYPPCTPIEAPYPCFSEIQKECCKIPRTECFEQTRIFRRQKQLGLLSLQNMRRAKKDKKFYSTPSQSILTDFQSLYTNKRHLILPPSYKRPSFVPKRDFSTVINRERLNSKWVNPHGSNVIGRRNISQSAKENGEKMCNQETEKLPGDTPKQSILEKMKRFFFISQNSTPVLPSNDILDASNHLDLYRGFSVAEQTAPTFSMRVSNDLLHTTETPTAKNRMYSGRQRVRSYTTGTSRMFRRKKEADLLPKRKLFRRRGNVRFSSSDDGHSPVEKECPKIKPEVKSKCRMPKPPTCGPNPRGFDCTIKVPYPPCVAQQAPYPSFSECQKECCKKARTECNEQDRVFDAQKRSGQLDMCNILKHPPKDFRHKAPGGSDPGCGPGKKEYSTLAKRDYSSYVCENIPGRWVTLQPVPEVPEEPTVTEKSPLKPSTSLEKPNTLLVSDYEKLKKAAQRILCSDIERLSDHELKDIFLAASNSLSPRISSTNISCWNKGSTAGVAKEAFLADTVKRFYRSLLTMPELSIMAKNTSGMLNDTQSSAIMVPLCNTVMGHPSMTFARVYSTLPQVRQYSSPKDCGIKNQNKEKEPCEKQGQQPCCCPKPRESCEVHQPYPQCTPCEAPYPSFSDCNKGFPRLAPCECTEQERLYVEMKNAGAYKMKTTKKPDHSLPQPCGTKINPNQEKKYSTCTDKLLIDPNEAASVNWESSDKKVEKDQNDDFSVKREMKRSASGSGDVEVENKNGLTVESQDVSNKHVSNCANFDGKVNHADESYISEIATRMKDVSLVGKGILSRCFQSTGIFAKNPQTNFFSVSSRNFATDSGGSMSDNYQKKEDCKLKKEDDKKSKCKLPAQPCCEPKYRETCEVEQEHPQCSPIEAPYASFSDCHRHFSLIPTSECSEQEKVFTRLRSSGAYELKNLKIAKKHTSAGPQNQKREFSSCPKKGDSPSLFLQELSEDSLKEMEEKELAKKVLTTVKNGMEAIAVSANDVEAQEAYFQLYEELEKLCENEFHRSMHISDDLEVQQPICSRDIFSDSCLNKNTVPSMADENLKQMMTIDAIKSFCKSMFAIPTMSTTLYEETEKYKTEKLQKELDDLLDQYKAPKIQ